MDIEGNVVVHGYRRRYFIRILKEMLLYIDIEGDIVYGY